MHLTLILITGFAAVLGFGFLALNILAWRHAFALLHYADEGLETPDPHRLTRREKAAVLLEGIRIPRPSGSCTPADHDMPFVSARIPTPSHVSLGAWYCPAAESANPSLVILFHGYAQDKSSLLLEAKALHDMGLSCLLVDFRGSGESSGSHTTIGVEESCDVAAAYRFAETRFPQSRLILFGQSMGSAAILRAIQEDPQVRPSAIIIESVFDSMYQTALNRFTLLKMPGFLNARLLLFWGGRQFGFNAFAHNPADYARSVSCPSLFFQGDADPRARPQDARRVFDAITSPDKEYREFEDHGHESCVTHHPDAWRETTRAFFRKYDLVA